MIKQIHKFIIPFLITATIGAYAQTPELVMDFNPSGDGNPVYLNAIGTDLFFSASNGIHLNGLWKSNGTASGTVLVKDPNPSGDSNIGPCAVLNSVLYFHADDGNGLELWRSDGTATGTYMVKDINPTGGQVYMIPIVYKGELYFHANDGIDGLELWKTNGTSAGTVMVKDFDDVSSFGSSYGAMLVYNQELYFGASDGIHGAELWKTNGTTAGTVMVKDLDPNGESIPMNFIVFKNKLFFYAIGPFGMELHSTDGTAAGTSIVKDINPGAGDSGYTRLFAIFNSQLYFPADDGVHGAELWKTDGTEAGTVMVKDIYPGPDTSYPFLEDSSYALYEGKIYFTATDNIHGSQLWMTDGTDAGTTFLTSINALSGVSNIKSLKEYHNRIYFSADSGVNDSELWKCGGTAASTGMVGDNNPNYPGFSPANYTVFNGSMYFKANDGTNGFELWKLTTPVSGILSPAPVDSDKIKIFPNPGSAQVTIDFTELKNVHSVFLYNNLGEKIKYTDVKMSSSSASFDIQELNPGVYYIILSDSEGQQLTKKLIKN